ncbi:NupC/NupG family nucleoside CNT transporter [Sutcliffiella sp. NC1]|uniref:NupC/NupG family nucleoside CNT transporter n=1 Tax=Sutcliffiella sp. NC1 TaxID=3004096 RepID=UPI0022DDA65D|nr:nucleoside transporter C-terminal domain-containing protein [Sutcliffiella sp. NC1]WBL14641.1 NupC/NupG family nucleoside CNT transporter [Sutcliffiella sp. NC1]
MIPILWGLAGCAILVAIAYLLSENKKAINVRTVTIGFLLQVILGFIVLKWEFGIAIIQTISNGVNAVMGAGREGLKFVFGELANADGPVGSVFVINALAIMIFLTALVAVLYHYKIMQFFVRVVGGFISKFMKTGYVESTNAVTNMFLGMTQSAVSVKPYISHISRSQIFAIMVGGLASVSGAVLFALSVMGIPIEYLLSAAIMSAPAGLMIAKLMIPETETIKQSEWKEIDNFNPNDGEDGQKSTLMDAIVEGARDGVKLAVNAAMVLVAIIGLVALVDVILSGAGSLVGLHGLSLKVIFGYLFAPVALIIGIPWSEAVLAGALLGEKIILNEFVAFASFSGMLESFSDRSVAILTFALSGFANIGSVGITLGIMLGIAPNRKHEIQSMAFKALIAGTIANLLNGAIAGMFFF